MNARSSGQATQWLCAVRIRTGVVVVSDALAGFDRLVQYLSERSGITPTAPTIHPLITC